MGRACWPWWPHGATRRRSIPWRTLGGLGSSIPTSSSRFFRRGLARPPITSSTEPRGISKRRHGGRGSWGSKSDGSVQRRRPCLRPPAPHRAHHLLRPHRPRSRSHRRPQCRLGCLPYCRRLRRLRPCHHPRPRRRRMAAWTVAPSTTSRLRSATTARACLVGAPIVPASALTTVRATTTARAS